MLYEELLIEANHEGLNVYERNIGNFKGLYVDGNIALNHAIETRAEKACVLAEELGHYHTTCGNILDQSKAENRKQERKARAWAYERLVNFHGLIEASKCGIKNKYELAEFFGVTEWFLEQAIQYYKEKYGMLLKLGCYIIYFEPLGVLKLLEE